MNSLEFTADPSVIDEAFEVMSSLPKVMLTIVNMSNAVDGSLFYCNAHYAGFPNHTIPSRQFTVKENLAGYVRRLKEDHDVSIKISNPLHEGFDLTLEMLDGYK